jgi:hypothetical protein
MPIITATVLSLVLFFMLALIGFFFLIGSYALLRLLRVPVNWITWVIGTLIMAASVVFTISVLTPGHLSISSHDSGLLGGLSFLVAVYSAGQWAMRRWYVSIKKHTASFLVKGSRDILLFLRKHHPFFGWIVALAAIGHMVYYLPILSAFTEYVIITGFVALGTLIVLVLLGGWIWVQAAVRKQRIPKVVYRVHSALAIVFFVTLVGGHFGAWLWSRSLH